MDIPSLLWNINSMGRRRNDKICKILYIYLHILHSNSHRMGKKLQTSIHGNHYWIVSKLTSIGKHGNISRTLQTGIYIWPPQCN